MSLWDFAVAVYGRPGVEETCLALQDCHGQSVPLILWRLWALDRAVDAGQLRAAVLICRAWEGSVLAPLRSVRRRLREPVPGVADPARLALRESVKADELMAERVLLEALEVSTTLETGPRADPLQALVALAAEWGVAAPTPLIARLAAAAASATG